MAEPPLAPAETWSGLDPRLAADSLYVCDLELCQVRLQDDVRWPWLVLIPRRVGLVEIEQLAEPFRALLMEEAVQAGAAVRAIGHATGVAVEKLNLGALGNVVRQLHVHVIGRREGDPAGAAPVWGKGEPQPYAEGARVAALAAARAAFAKA